MKAVRAHLPNFYKLFGYGAFCSLLATGTVFAGSVSFQTGNNFDTYEDYFLSGSIDVGEFDSFYANVGESRFQDGSEDEITTEYLSIGYTAASYETISFSVDYNYWVRSSTFFSDTVISSLTWYLGDFDITFSPEISYLNFAAFRSVRSYGFSSQLGYSLKDFYFYLGHDSYEFSSFSDETITRLSGIPQAFRGNVLNQTSTILNKSRSTVGINYFWDEIVMGIQYVEAIPLFGAIKIYSNTVLTASIPLNDSWSIDTAAVYLNDEVSSGTYSLGFTYYL